MPYNGSNSAGAFIGRREMCEADGIWRVLVIDDHESVRHCLAYALDSYGYEVVTCANASEALEQCKEKPFDFVITDYDMPGITGIELTRVLRKSMPEAVIIGISSSDLGVEFLQAGANDFRQKPFVPFEIAMMIDGADLDDPYHEPRFGQCN